MKKIKSITFLFLSVLLITSCRLATSLEADPNAVSEDPTATLQKISLSIDNDNITLDENNVLSIVLVFDQAAQQAASLQWDIVGGENDFDAISGSESIAKGSSSKNITINVTDDAVFEVTKNYTLTISGDESIKNSLNISITLNDNDTPLADPTLSITDINTSSTSLANQQSISLSLGSDGTATHWCVSEIQSAKPDSVSDICTGGQGATNGWHTTRPTSFNVSSGDNLKTVYLWIADVSGNLNAGPITDTITLDDSDPATPTVSMTDTISSSSTNAYSNPVNISITSDVDAVKWCIIEQSSAAAIPSTPAWNDACFVGTRPTQVTLSSTGNRKSYVFTQDTAGNIASPGVATITYATNQNPSLSNDGPIIIAKDSSTMSIDVLANDSDPESETLSITSKTDGSNSATVTITGSGTGIDYTPASGFYGVDSFTYTVEDPRGGSNTATVTVHVMTPFTWTGAASGDLWNTSGNWCGSITGGACAGGSAPGTSDIAIFNGTCTNCNATIDSSITIQGVEMGSTYSGTLTQGSGNTITVTSSHWTQNGGTFIGSNATMNTHYLIINGGSFTATSDTINIGEGLTLNNSTVDAFTLGSGATFNHNNGTVKFKIDNNWNHNVIVEITSASGSLTFNNIIVDKGTGSTSGTTTTRPKSGTSILVLGSLTHTDEKLDGQWELKGDFNIGAAAEGSTNAVLNMTGTGNQEYSYTTSGISAGLIINKPSGTVAPATGTTNFSVREIILTQGSFTAPTGDLYLGNGWYKGTGTYDLLSLAAGTTFNHNSGTVVVKADNSWTGNSIAEISSASGSISFNNFTVSTGVGSTDGSNTTQPKSGTAITILGDFTHSDEKVSGQWDVLGDFYVDATAEGGIGGIISLVSTGNQEYNTSGSGHTAALEVNKSSGTVTPATGVTDISLSHLILTQGSFTAPTGILKLGAGWFKPTGTYNMLSMATGTTFNHNNGTVKFVGDNNWNNSPIGEISSGSGSITFYNIIVDKSTGSTSGAFITRPQTGTTVNVAGTFTHTDEKISGTWNLSGNFTQDSTAEGGTASLIFDGTGTQYYSDNGGTSFSGNITVNKASGSVEQSSNASFNSSGQSLDIQSGGWTMGGYSLTINNTLGLATGTSVTRGGGTLTVGGSSPTDGAYDNGTINP